MIDVRRVVRGLRFRKGWRASALVAWMTSLAVLFAQGISPSYAGITVTKLGSPEALRMQVLERSAGVPTKVAAYIADAPEPVITSIDPGIARNARWTVSGKNNGWTQGRAQLDAPGLPRTLDVSYRSTEAGLDVITSDPANPANTLSLRVSPGEAAAPEVWIPIIAIAAAILAVLACSGASAIRDESCADAAKKTCGERGVKCVTSSQYCGFGSCSYYCQGDSGSCE
jgi:hypothetical protein